MHESGYELVTVYGALVSHACPASYVGVTYLADRGETQVIIQLPCGVKKFPRVPYMIKVPVEQTFVEFRKNEQPVLTVNFWEPYY